MKDWKTILLQILGGIGWLMYGIALMLGGALDNSTSVWLCIASLLLGICMVYFGVDKLLSPKRW